jgi:acyl-CoA reductase-like NAD-dependent aldehyde dehydrogenase
MLNSTDMSRIAVNKTYKIFIGGKFPRTESGRYYPLQDKKGNLLANLCLSSRKDFRNAVVAARKAQSGWASASAMNKGQILYRLAEMLEGRREQFVQEIQAQGSSLTQASNEVDAAIDRLVYYAGWSDKYQQIFSSVNPVSSPHFNFSNPEPMGVVAIIAPEEQGLLGLVSVLAPVIVGGNAAVLLASQSKPLSAISFSEVIHTSDVPAGVVNILTGERSELLPHMASHMDVNAIVYCGSDDEEIRKVSEMASENVKRTVFYKKSDWRRDSNQSPYFIEKTQEIKTTWHPVKI